MCCEYLLYVAGLFLFSLCMYGVHIYHGVCMVVLGNILLPETVCAVEDKV